MLNSEQLNSNRSSQDNNLSSLNHSNYLELSNKNLSDNYRSSMSNLATTTMRIPKSKHDTKIVIENIIDTETTTINNWNSLWTGISIKSSNTKK